MKRIERLFRDATSFHKATCLLSTKFTGVKDFDENQHMWFPMLYKDTDGSFIRSNFVDERADPEWNKDGDSYFSALVVNGSFSLELHLKHLYELVEHKPAKGHGVGELFKGLCDYTKTELEKIFQAISSSQPLIKQSFDAINRELGVKRDWTIESVLDDSNDAFVSWRYGFEDPKKPSSFTGYGEAIYAMRIISTQYKANK